MNKQSNSLKTPLESNIKNHKTCQLGESLENKLKVRYITIGDDDDQRLDNYLCRTLKGVPKSRIYRIIRKGEVRVNKKRVSPSYRVQEGDYLRVPPVAMTEKTDKPYIPTAVSKRLTDSVLYEDNGLIIINKPSGLAVHGGSGISCGVIEAFRQIYPDERNLELVHRLDRDTSGCLMIAKKRSILRHIHAQLQNRSVQKVYHALVNGHWPAHKQLINAPLQKNILCSGERIVRVHTDGKISKTHYRVLKRLANTTLVEACPLTGRTHQIRVHCLQAGHAILGDDKYGRDEDNQRYKQKGLKRLFLHASNLQLTLPSGKVLNIEAPLPDELQKVLHELEKT